MRSKAHILIVEDEPVLYRRLRNILQKEYYSVAPFTVSVAEALTEINRKKPDLILLDIQLEGQQTGLDLGKILYDKYKIPFIYVTEFDDNQTFYKGLETHHEQFLVKTKPNIDETQILRAIQTSLNKQSKNSNAIIKENIEVLVDYLENIREFPKDKITRKTLAYRDIMLFTTDNFRDENNDLRKVKNNYIAVITKNDDYYFIKKSLQDLSHLLPEYFVKINQAHIVNILPDILKGRINGHQIMINQKILKITNTYKENFEKIYQKIYQT